MSLRSQAAADVRTNLTADGDAVTLTNPEETDFPVVGKVVRIDAVVDPQTGVQVLEPKTVVTVPIMTLDGGPTEGWEVATTDGEGNAITGRVRAPRFDHTLCFVTFDVEDYDDGE